MEESINGNVGYMVFRGPAWRRRTPRRVAAEAAGVVARQRRRRAPPPPPRNSRRTKPTPCSILPPFLVVSLLIYIYIYIVYFLIFLFFFTLFFFLSFTSFFFFSLVFFLLSCSHSFPFLSLQMASSHSHTSFTIEINEVDKIIMLLPTFYVKIELTKKSEGKLNYEFQRKWNENWFFFLSFRKLILKLTFCFNFLVFLLVFLK